MPEFAYLVQTEKGRTLKGLLTAESLDAATKILQRDGFILSLTLQNGPSPIQSFLRNLFSSRAVSNRDLMFFTRELSSLLRGGVALIRALSMLAKNAENPKFASALNDITQKVAGGKHLHEALAEHPRIFPPLYVGLIEAGAASGQLQPILGQLAKHLHSSQKMRSKVKSAMTYPAIVLVVSVGVLIFFSIKIVPPFATVFRSFNMKLPAATALIVTVSDFLTRNFIAVVFAACALLFIAKSYLATETGRYHMAWAKLKLPIVRNIYENAVLERFLSVFSLLLSSGVSMLKALDFLKSSLDDNPIYAGALNEAQQLVSEGKTLALALGNAQVFPRLVIDHVESGEESGHLMESMGTLSEYYGEKTETAVENLTTALEPIMTIVMGSLVGFILFALFLPMIQLSSIKPQ